MTKFTFNRMSAELAAMRKASRGFQREHDRLAKDGWSEAEIEEILAEYGESWGTGLLQERFAKARRGQMRCPGSGTTVVAALRSAALPRVVCAECGYDLVVPDPPPPIAPEHIWREPKPLPA